MKKRMLATLLVAMSTLMVACGSQNAEADSAAVGTESSSAETHKVTYYDADGSVLKEAQVEHGQQAEDFQPEKDGYIFMGWYISPELTRKFDFERPIKADAEVYGGYSKYVEDARNFYIVGSGKSQLLSKSDWGKVIDDSFALTKEESDNANVYTITVDLEAGDSFQFATDENWADQRGFGYLETGLIDGKEYLKNAGGLGDTPPAKSNIEVQVAGTYTFTLTTYPDSDVYDTENEYYTEETKENFNSNPFDKITWTYAE